MKCLVAIALVALSKPLVQAESYDLVIYGSSPAAISAAVQAKRMGKRAVVVSPETRIGGLTTGGQCAGLKGEDSMWTFEPSAALKILEVWEKREGLEIHRGKMLDRAKGKVKVEGEGERRRIVSFVTEDGVEYCGKMFVDATYEGDLMAAAGVSYVVGREAARPVAMAIGGGRPYPIDYGAIIPKRGECANLFVPVCLSASHMAFGSIRMEPVFFALGQAAATAAAQAIDAGVSVQDLAYASLAGRLLSDGQVLGGTARLGACGGRLARTVVVAAANSDAEAKSLSDLVCTGTNDERVISGAIAKLVKGGTVQLLDGDYWIDGFEHEGNSAIFYGENGGSARVVNVVGTTENKGYNTRHGVGIHVRQAAMDAMKPDETYRVFYGTSFKPKAKGDFYTYTHLTNVGFDNFYLFLADASKQIRGIDGSNFGSMDIRQVGVYTERYFEDRFLHEKPKTPAKGSVGVWSVPGSNDEMARIGYDCLNVGGLYIGIYCNEVDHLIMRTCTTARCCWGYWFVGGPKTLTMLNCCDEGNVHLPRFSGRGHLTAIDFNVERFNAAYIPDCPDCDGQKGPHGAVEDKPGSWKGFISYTMQGEAFGLKKFWNDGSGVNFKTVNLDHDRRLRAAHPEPGETHFDANTRRRALPWQRNSTGNCKPRSSRFER